MYHLHALKHMSYVYLYIFLTRKSNTSFIEAPFLWSGCGPVVLGAGHKAKRLVLQCINAVSSNPVEGRTKIWQLKKLTLLGLIFRRIYIYIKKSNEIRMLVHIKEISKKKNKTDFSQHSCTNVFTAVADLQVQCL